MVKETNKALCHTNNTHTHTQNTLIDHCELMYTRGLCTLVSVKEAWLVRINISEGGVACAHQHH